jgi:phage terminase large subunit-like protein
MKRALIFIIGLILAVAMFSEAHAQRAVAFFEMLKHTDGQFYNQPFVLLPWQKQIIRDVYGTLKENGARQYKTVYLEVPKKNGKSELAAGAALYHLFADGEIKGEIYGCAVDKGQAGIVYHVARDMIELVPALAKRARVTDSTKKITDKVSGSVYQVLSADAFRKHGFKVSACIFDELHAQPNRNLWDVMTFEAGATRRQPIWWIITTAGEDPDRVSIGWEQHEYAMKILSGEIVDPTWYVVIYNYDGDDIYNEENWFAANPSLGSAKSLESMRETATTAKNKPANERLFRWLDLNQWITSKLSPWLPLDLFDKTIGEWDRKEQDGRDCYLGLDLSTTTDLSAINLTFPPQGAQYDWRTFWECWIPKENMQERIERDHVPYDKWVEQGWVTATEGNVIDYTVIRQRILDLSKIYKIIEVVADPAFATMLLQVLANDGLTVVTVPQTFVNLTDPMNQLEIFLNGKKPEGGAAHLLQGSLTHENNMVARWAFGNTEIAKNGAGLIKYVKQHKGKSVVRTKRIDPIAAWVTNMCRARFYKGTLDLSAKILNEEWGM